MRRTPLKRTESLARQPMRRTRPRPTIPAALRAQLVERSGGWCEARLPGCTGRATDACHRVTRGMGGRLDDGYLSNLWHGCRTCHRWTHDRPTEANELGLMLENWQDPRQEPMAYQSAGMVLLQDDGGLWPFGDAA